MLIHQLVVTIIETENFVIFVTITLFDAIITNYSTSIDLISYATRLKILILCI